MPAPISPIKKRSLLRLVNEGWTVKEAAQKAGVSYAWARDYLRGEGNMAGPQRKTELERLALDGPKTRTDLVGEPLEALDDFRVFRQRYMGRVASPWQEEAAQTLVRLLESPQKEYVVVNCPPGAGKSTLFTHDIPAWMICRNRAVRMILGSRTEKQAVTYVNRLKRTLERVVPVKADSDLLAKGRAFDAIATLSGDYGAFRPQNPDIWRNDQFIVEQFGGVAIDEKEPTAVAFGMNSGSLGWRVDYILWDDLVDNSTVRTEEMRVNQQVWWEDEAETRLEPDGLLVLQGQRIAPLDLYRYCLDMEAGDPDDTDAAAESFDETQADWELWEAEHRSTVDRPKKYHHIVYKAHYEDRCSNVHKPSLAQPYPNGCLLDPIRLPWRELATKQRNSSAKYRVLYQQEDIDPAGVLVNPLWVKGGRDANGNEFQGCWDNNRDLWELPPGLSGDLFVVATADPSPTKFWSCQVWCYHPDSQQRFLLDLKRQTMDAPDFLDWNANDGVFSGVMEEWQNLSVSLNIPIRYWVVEHNSAQRFMLQYDHVRRWVAKHGVQIVGHDTNARNKADPDLGVQTIAPHWQHGRVRLPGKQHTEARYTSMKLVDEVTRYPEGRTDDCVMAEWFFEWNLPRLYLPANRPVVRAWRPSWMRAREMAG